MNRTTQIAVFLSVAIAIGAGMHYLIWARLFRDTAAPPGVRRVAAIVLVLLLLSMPVTMVTARTHGVNPFAWLTFLWMGASFYFFVTLVATDVVYLMARVSGTLDPERRIALRRLLGGLAALVAVSASGAAVFEALRRMRIVDVEVPLARLPKSLDGFTIVQVSDIHIGSTIGRPFMESLVHRINALAPDLIAITGDLVDGSVARLGHATAPLEGLKSKHGTFFVTGNHEYYSGAVEWVEELRRLGVRVLRNERVTIAPGLELAGVDDWHALGHAPGHGANLSGALEGYDRSHECVLLAHQPAQAIEAAKLGVGLQLSGHTHGGQLWPFNYLVKLQQPFIAGLDKLDQLQVYTSRGTGYWGPPMRLGAPAEITRIKLRAI